MSTIGTAGAGLRLRVSGLAEDRPAAFAGMTVLGEAVGCGETQPVARWVPGTGPGMTAVGGEGGSKNLLSHGFHECRLIR